MEMRGIKLEDLFRANYNLSKEIDIFVLIQEAISAASLGNPKEFMMKRSSLAEALFRKPRDPCWVESDVEDDDTACDDHPADHGEDSRKSNLIITSPDALISSKDDHATTKNHCDRSDNDGSKKGMRIIIKYPKMPKEANKMGLDQQASRKHCAPLDDNGNKMGRGRLIKFPERKKRKENTSDVNKSLNQDMASDGLANGGVASRKNNLTTRTDALTIRETKRHCVRLDDNGDEWERRTINVPKGHKEVSKKLDQVRGCDGHPDGKSSKKEVSKECVCTFKKDYHCSDDIGNTTRERLMKLSERPKEVTTQAKKKLHKEQVQTKLAQSVKKMEWRYQQIRENERKIQILDVKDLPLPKSRCNNIPQPRPFPSFNKQQRFRRPVFA